MVGWKATEDELMIDKSILSAVPLQQRGKQSGSVVVGGDGEAEIMQQEKRDDGQVRNDSEGATVIYSTHKAVSCARGGKVHVIWIYVIMFKSFCLNDSLF